MNELTAAAMGRALEQTRAGNPVEATRVLQDALNGVSSTSVEPLPAPSINFSNRAMGKTRRPLGQVIDSLVNGNPLRTPGMMPLSGRKSKLPQIPEGAQYSTRRHESAFGSCDYKLFVPSSRSEPAQGLVLMLHGCTQDADDFATGTQMNVHAEKHNLIVVYAEQNRQENSLGCWNWFRPEDQSRGRGEPALLADLATQVAGEHAVDKDRVFAAGLSAGAAMAAILGSTHPEVFAAIGVHSGLAAGSASDVVSAFAAMRGQGGGRRSSNASTVPTIVFHGTADTTVSPSNAGEVIDAALSGSATILSEDTTVSASASNTVSATRTLHRQTDGKMVAENWTLDGIAHAWSGGSPEGTYTHPNGPDASAEMIRFFLEVASEDRT